MSFKVYKFFNKLLEGEWGKQGALSQGLDLWSAVYMWVMEIEAHSVDGHFHSLWHPEDYLAGQNLQIEGCLLGIHQPSLHQVDVLESWQPYLDQLSVIIKKE